MYLADYHVHSTCSQDGRQTMAQAAQAAVAAGLDELCLTDHVDTVYWGPEQKPRWDFDWDAVRRQFCQAQEQWGHRITLRLGAEHAFACDIDEKCVEVAYENAALNDIDRSRYTVRWGDVLSDQQLKAEIGGGYDMVVANIVADVIIGLSGQVRPFLKEGGLFLCSGIIDDRAEEVAQRLREVGWNILRTRQSEGWFSYLCR